MTAAPADLAPAPATLHLALVGELERRGLRYVYWKPRHGAAAAMRGGSKDLDILLDPPRVGDAQAVLRSLGYKRFLLPEGAVPDSEAWVAWDGANDRFYFAHVCWRIHTGRPGVHEQELPWVEALLEQTEPSTCGARVLLPEAELLLTAVRAVFDPKLWAGSRGTLSEAALGTLRDAREHSTPDALARLSGRLFPGHGERTAALALDPSLASDATAWERWRALVRRALSPTRRSTIRAELQWARGVARSWLRSSQRRWRSRAGMSSAPESGRLRREGGFLVGLTGPDGAGKSTIADALVSWMAELFAVESLYLGRGEWVSRAQQAAAEVKWEILERVSSATRPGPTGPGDDDGRRDPHASPKQQRMRWVRDASAVALAQRKRRALRRAARLRRRGWILITDRFPHPTEKLCDGPAIVVGDADPWARRALEHVERGYFREIVRTRPDLLVRLLLPVEESIRRKPDHRAEDIRAKLAAARRARFEADATLEVAADAPLEEVLQTIKAAVWREL